MKALRASLLILLAAGGADVLAGSAAAPAAGLTAGWQGRLAALLPQPGQLAQLMQQQPRLSFVELQQRVTRVGGSRDALRALMLRAARGEPLEYDARLGITQEEFRRYLVFQPVLTPTGKTTRLNVVRDGSLLRFGDAPGLNGVLRGLVLDLSTGELRTPEGFSTRPRTVPPNNAVDRTLDIRGGFEWNLKGNNPVTQNGIKSQLQLLQLPGNQVVFTYTHFGMMRGVISEGSVILSYTR